MAKMKKLINKWILLLCLSLSSFVQLIDYLLQGDINPTLVGMTLGLYPYALNKLGYKSKLLDVFLGLICILFLIYFFLK